MARRAALLDLKGMDVPGAGHCVVLGDAILMGRHGVAMRILMGVEKQTKKHFSRVLDMGMCSPFSTKQRRSARHDFWGF